MLQHLTHTRLHKKQRHQVGCMSLVTYCNIWLKCYINFLCIVADGKRSSNVLAKALTLYLLFLEVLKKICYLFSSTYSLISVVTISFTVVFCFSATILRSVLRFSSISMTNCFLSLILITTLVSYVLVCKDIYKYIFIVIQYYRKLYILS